MPVRRAIFEFNPRDLSRLRALMVKKLKIEIPYMALLQTLNDVLNDNIIPKISRGLPQKTNLFGSEFEKKLKAYAKPRQRQKIRTRKV